MKTTPCSYCHQPTNRVYSDNRAKGINKPLVSSCEPCSKNYPYLKISLIFKKSTYQPLEIVEPETTHQENRESLNEIEETI